MLELVLVGRFRHIAEKWLSLSQQSLGRKARSFTLDQAKRYFLIFSSIFYSNGNYCSLHCTALMQKDGTGCQFWHWEDEC